MPSENSKILIVEDESIVAKSLENKLIQSGYQVVGTAFTGSDAVAMVNDRDPDLVIMDIKLKGRMSGIEAAESIKKKIGKPVIFLTSYTDEETFKRAKKAEPVAYLKKPFEIDELKRVLDISLLNNKIREELKLSKKRYEMAVEAGKTGVFEIFLDERKLFADKNLIRLFGYRINELKENLREWVELIHPEDIESAKNYYRSVLSSGGNKMQFRFRIKRKDGRISWVEFSGNLSFFENSLPKRIVGTLTDITEKKLSEDALSKSEAKFKDVFESAGIGMAIISLKKEFMKINRSFCEMLGYSESEFSKLNVNDITHPDDISDSENIANGLIYHKLLNPQKQEKRYLHKNGSVIWADVIISLLRNVQGKPLYFITQVQDISQRIEAENQLKKYTDELKASNEAKDKFFSIISHDLRSPFHTLLGVSEYLSEYAQDLTNEEIKEASGGLNKSAHNVYDLLMNLLEWSRVQTGNLKVNPMLIDITDLINEAVEVYREVARRKNVELVKNLTPELFVKVDRYMIDSVLRNLISNAVKFTESGGKIILSCEEKDGYVTIDVADTGIGIDKLKLNDLFDIDKQFSTKGTSREQGTGLGLILVKEFVEKNNGFIKVESKKGKGSKFTVVLPISEKNKNQK